MSYEGLEEYLCEKGHYHIYGCWEVQQVNACPICGSQFAWWHSVDQTNGYDPEDSGTFVAAKTEIGFEDDWKQDHYGNRYAVKIPLYAPPQEHSRWMDLSSIRKKISGDSMDLIDPTWDEPEDSYRHD